MKILITGGTGYIGAELTKFLITQSAVSQIIVYDNLVRKNHNFFTSYRFDSKKVSFIEGDLLDSRKLRKAISGCDIVYHLAALTDKNPSLDSHYFEQVNHWGTSELVNIIEESSVSKVIYTSSLAVYGEGSEVFSDESTPNPRSFYATSKLRGEEQVLRLRDKKSIQVLRIGNVYGASPCMRFDGVINKFAFDAHFKGRIQIHGNGRQNRSYISIQNLTSVLSSLISTNLKSDVCNLTDFNLQVLDIVESLQELYPSLEFIFINQHLKIGDLMAENGQEINKILLSKPSGLIDDLKVIKNSFSF